MLSRSELANNRWVKNVETATAANASMDTVIIVHDQCSKQSVPRPELLVNDYLNTKA